MMLLGGGWGADFAEKVKARPAALEAVNAITRGKELLAQGINTGITGKVATDLQRLDTALFNSDPQKAARTQEFAALMGDVVIKRLADLGGIGRLLPDSIESSRPALSFRWPGPD